METLPLSVLSEVRSFLSHALLFLTCAQAAEGGSQPDRLPFEIPISDFKRVPCAAWKRVLLSSLCFLPFSPGQFLKYSLLSRTLDLSPSQLTAPEMLSPGSPRPGTFSRQVSVWFLPPFFRSLLRHHRLYFHSSSS